jgi:glycine/D-amino acid oxidase-like deaminating enzyme/nitrite reductase/ring-hydroxylating ferredoxin subunit
MAGKLDTINCHLNFLKRDIMINRDGNRTSLWQATINPYQTRMDADKSMIYDIAIAGGGITGITTALLLQQAGKKCIVFEAANICFGTTGGTTAHLNTLLDTPYTTISKNFGKENTRLVASAAADAIDLVRENISLYKIDCEFEEADAYLFSQNDKQSDELDEIIEAATDAGLDASLENDLPVSIPFEKVMKVKGQAKFSPVKYVYALAKAFEKAGGIILQDCRVTGVEEIEPLQITTSKGLYRARDLIYATHIPAGVNLLHLRCAPYRSYVVAVKLKNENYPRGLCYDMNDPYNYYREQLINGEPYFIAGGYDHKTAHEENTEKRFLQLESHVRKYFDVKELVYEWSSQYFEPADGIPYIGHLPGHPNNIYVATGYGGNGMVYSHVSAMLLKKILLNQESSYISLFNPNRIKPVAGFKNFISHNADVIKQFSGKWFAHEKLEELVDLAPGEGKVVIYNNQKIALHKDEDNVLHAINPVCTHLKCEVAWNIAEQTWDCPCHGARYSYNGKMVTGPANRDLEEIEIRALVEKK